MEIRTELKVFKVERRCPKCNVGKLESDGRKAYLTMPMKYKHECTKCDYVEMFDKIYPCTEYCVK